jgi:primosomal protein N' (replication factor Y)
MDRDTTRLKGSLERLVKAFEAGAIDLLVGTQMLAKGHHFPNVTLVGVLDADGGLFGADFRAPERMAQLITQVAGRAGRGRAGGNVLIQTHHPDHPLLRVLLSTGYGRFCEALLAERGAAALPPFSRHALLRAEAAGAGLAMEFLGEAGARAAARAGAAVSVLGPVPAPMERRAGRYRAQLLLESPGRAELHALLGAWLPELDVLPSARRVRWSLDVDPQEML